MNQRHASPSTLATPAIKNGITLMDAITQDLEDLYTAYLTATLQEFQALTGDLQIAPDAWQARQQATTDARKDFTQACEQAGLSEIEGLRAATINGWMGPDGITYPSKNAYYQVMKAGSPS